MATKTNLSKTVRENIPFILASNNGAMNKKDLRDAYVAHEGCSDEHDFGTINNKSKWSRLRSAIHSQTPKLIKMGILYQPAKGKFDVVQGATTSSAFVPFLKGQSAPVVEQPPVEAEVEPVQEVAVVETVETAPVEVVEQPTQIEVEVDNPAVIEAHIDTTTNELVENIGGSQDWRNPLDEVEDGYITSNVPSSVQVSTTTLETVEVQEEVVEASVEPEEVVEVVEATPVEETVVEDQEDDLFEVEPPLEVELLDDQDVQPSYNLQELRKSVSFDPCNVVLSNDVSGQYEVYRDIELRNIVLTQKGRDDYEVISMDVDLERISNIPTNGEKYARYAKKAIEAFDQAKNHKEGCLLVVKSVISCCEVCNHTDDFGGFVEPCMASDRTCVLKSVWADGATYVNPQDS